jgi:hypothetical protein
LVVEWARFRWMILFVGTELRTWFGGPVGLANGFYAGGAGEATASLILAWISVGSMTVPSSRTNASVTVWPVGWCSRETRRLVGLEEVVVAEFGHRDLYVQECDTAFGEFVLVAVTSKRGPSIADHPRGCGDSAIGRVSVFPVHVHLRSRVRDKPHGGRAGGPSGLCGLSGCVRESEDLGLPLVTPMW